MNNNINPYTNKINTNKPQEHGQYNGYTTSYGGEFGESKYDSYSSLSSDEPQSFWQKWKKTFIIGGTLIFAGVLSVIGYNKGWFGKLKTKFNSWIDKPQNNSKNNEAQEIQKCFEDLNIKDIKLSDGKTTTIQDLIKKDKIEGKDFVTLATCLKNKCDKTKKASIVQILNFFKGKLSVDRVGTFTKSKDIKEDNLDNILKSIIEESSANPSDSAYAKPVVKDPESLPSSSTEENGDVTEASDVHEPEGEVQSAYRRIWNIPEASDVHNTEDEVHSHIEENGSIPNSLDEIEQNIRNNIEDFVKNNRKDFEALKKEVEKELHKIAKAEDKAQCLHTAGFELSKAVENGDNVKASKLYQQAAELYQKAAEVEGIEQDDKAMYLNNAGSELSKAARKTAKSNKAGAIELYKQAAQLYQQAAKVEGIEQDDKAMYLNNAGSELSKAAENVAKSGDNVQASELYQQAAEVEGIEQDDKTRYLNKAGSELSKAAEKAEENGDNVQASKLYQQAAQLYQQAAEVEGIEQNDKTRYLNKAGFALSNAAKNVAKSGDNVQASKLYQQAAQLYQQAAKVEGIEQDDKARYLNDAGSELSKAAKNAEESGDNVRAIELYKQAAGIEGLDPSKKVEYLKKALKSLKNGFDALEKNDLSLESTDKKRLFKDLSKQANKLEQQVNNLCQEVNNESIEQLNADIEMLQEKFAEILNKDINSVVLSINNTIEELDSYKKVSDIAKNTLTIINTIFSGYNKAQKLSVKTQGKVYENITETLKQVSEAYQKFAQAQMEPELKLTLLHEAAERFSEKISLNKGIFSRKKTDDVDLKKYQVVTELYTQTAILYHKTAKAAETKESKEKFYCIAIGYLREQICWLDKCKNTTEIDKTTNKILALYQEAIDAGVNKNTMQEFLTEQVSTLNVQLEDSESASDEAWNAQKRLANMQKTDKT